MAGCDAVVHAASMIGGWGAPALYEECTVRGTRNVIAAMAASSVDALINISTISVHGLDPTEGTPISEADGFGSHFLPYDHYGRAKIAAENAVAEAHAAGRIQATTLRPGWMYGPRDINSYGRLADMMRRGIAVRVGTGENRIPLTHAGNVASAIWRALATQSSDYRVYLCADDGKVTQSDYFASLARATDTKRRPMALSKRSLLALAMVQEHISILFGYRIPVPLSRYVVHLLGSDWCFDQSAIGRDLGYSPKIGYEQGFAATEQWYRESRSVV
jgi:nucleoside-diphosphate-sugar epimerase